ncbi:hypothetical protein CB0940_04094 [Cercospora beticola]|uniref:Uncharacterized protein n=2 Tax=Cercospora beticola TaxID=122368 RepID=A0A2G5HK04_CERBT|nr:hypothetical protein CB0940_04094 [Cercospora beticola]PIA92552.1 hypothetical protein CB0940_04094 [Cercospora beticola]
MLTPHLQQSIASARPRSMSTSALRSSTSTLARPGTTSIQARSLWWRRPCDYTSQIDPMYHRMTRYRTLKTRAKMLDKLRRRGRWDWDLLQRPFLTPKHIRWASHVGRPRWAPEQEQDKQNHKAQARKSAEDDGIELSQRERQWKEHMEALRKRINEDPYEAVFGRRFEPFWNSLVPSWMKEEMGMKDASRSKDPSEAKANPSTTPSRPQKVDPSQVSYRPLEPETKRQVHSSNGAPQDQAASTRYQYDPKKTTVDVSSDTPDGQQTSYSYGATTSWDSWTKKASRVEWDSVSGEKRRYEYDPISNRMVQVKGPPVSEVRKVEDALKDYPARSQSPLMSHGWQSGLGNPSTESATVGAPVNAVSETKKAISVPTQDSKGRKTSVYFPSLINTSVVANAPKAASLTKHEKYPDSLTAADVRASVGQKKAEKSAVPIRTTVDTDRAYRHGKPDPRKMSEWEQAEHRVMLNQELYDVTKQKMKLLKQEVGAFHVEKIQREIARLEEKASALHKELDTMDAVNKKPLLDKSVSKRVPIEQMGCNDMMIASLDTTKLPARAQSTSPAATPAPTRLQPALDRMQHKSTPLTEEPDDSAAHESTGEFGEYKSNEVAKQREDQAALFQADRIQRRQDLQDSLEQKIDDLRVSGANMLERMRERRSLEDRVQGDVLGRKSSSRWVDIASARKATSDANEAAEKLGADVRDMEKRARLLKANALLQAEVEEQKNRMNAREHQPVVSGTIWNTTSISPATVPQPARDEVQRCQEKIKELRKELDIAYRQSSENSEGHVDTIRKLEKRLQTTPESRSETSDVEKKKYIKKIKALREELDTTFKQSSINAEMLVERIRELEKEVERARSSDKPVEAVQAEGDMSTNVTKFAKDSSKWYKQDASALTQGLQQLQPSLKSLNNTRDQALSEYDLRAGSAYEQKASQEKPAESEPKPHPIDQALAEYERRAAQKKHDQALVKEVRDIHENRYGKIDVDHRQSNVDAALEAHEKTHTARQIHSVEAVELEANTDLGNALAEHETGQKYKFQPDNLEAELAQQNKESREAESIMDKEVYGTRSVDADIQHPIRATTMPGLEWEEPPIYKVLAYDSGNDFLVTSTTSTNFTGKETPISIPEALSQLYQPARFIPEFAELQKQGFQVIYGTKDLLVFRKAKSTTEAATPAPESTPAFEDHGLVAPAAVEPTAAESAPKINPVDKTGYEEPATGSFASPTGFVGDRWEHEAAQKEAAADEDTEIKHYPRVTRQEQVFSGTRLKSSSSSTKKDRSTKNEEKEQRRKYRSWRQSAKWALFSGLGAGTVAYSIGAAAESSREKEYKRWQKILAEQRAMGGLGADGKRLQQGGGVFWR